MCFPPGSKLAGAHAPAFFLLTPINAGSVRHVYLLKVLFMYLSGFELDFILRSLRINIWITMATAGVAMTLLFIGGVFPVELGWGKLAGLFLVASLVVTALNITFQCSNHFLCGISFAVALFACFLAHLPAEFLTEDEYLRLFGTTVGQARVSFYFTGYSLCVGLSILLWIVEQISFVFWREWSENRDGRAYRNRLISNHTNPAER